MINIYEKFWNDFKIGELIILQNVEKMIDINLKFHAVGQGAFYTGIFRHQNGNQFSFVYDCGSYSSRRYIDHEISNFVSESEGKKN